ncbi:preprotein translocase subunit YajC [Anatilimnocola sp. NA78]|uniref:preprotein translocase subunit YajC n=1 Tax=Anatilimnocola sp. NA78 TaxID=3415683 RepID=UPI003CE51238
MSGLLGVFYLTSLLLAQGAGAAPAAPAAGGGGGFTEQLFGSFALPIMAMLLLMYFMLLRPEQKKRKEAEQTLASLKKNDHVVTIGGICGTVVNISPGSSTITIRVDDNTRLKILRSAVARIGEPEESTEADKKPA